MYLPVVLPYSVAARQSGRITSDKERLVHSHTTEYDPTIRVTEDSLHAMARLSGGIETFELSMLAHRMKAKSISKKWKHTNGFSDGILARFPRSEVYKFFGILCDARAHAAELEARARGDQDGLLDGALLGFTDSTKTSYLGEEEEE